jgi:hypothetical protein
MTTPRRCQGELAQKLNERKRELGERIVGRHSNEFPVNAKTALADILGFSEIVRKTTRSYLSLIWHDTAETDLGKSGGVHFKRGSDQAVGSNGIYGFGNSIGFSISDIPIVLFQ